MFWQRAQHRRYLTCTVCGVEIQGLGDRLRRHLYRYNLDLGTLCKLRPNRLTFDIYRILCDDCHIATRRARGI